jgi:3-phenylpropionate/trans-cinnamate dioxygenase ferredoxin reductase subunit
VARRPVFAIAGGGLAAGRAVERLLELGFEGQLVLLTDEPRLPHERPPLSKQYLKGKLAEARLLVRPAAFYAENAVEVRTSTRVAAVSPSERTLTLADGERLRYDRLLLALGSEPVRPAIPGAELPGVATLRTVEDAHRIHDRLRPGAGVLILGAGLLGSEVAATAREMGCDVHLVEAGKLPLAALGSVVAAWAADQHREHGVHLLTTTTATRFEGSGQVEAAILEDGTVIPCQLVVVAVGARPRLQLAQRAGLRVRDGVLVDGALRTSAPEILAAGDIARFPSPGGSTRSEHWDNAQLQGRHAAEAMLGPVPDFSALPYVWTELYGSTVQQLGDWAPERPWLVRGDPASGRFTALQLEGGRLVACVAVNQYPALKWARQVMESKTPLDPDRLDEEGPRVWLDPSAGPMTLRLD